MKRYSIVSPEQLKAAALLMKRKNDVQSAHTVAVVWSASERSGKTVPFMVYIDLGRNATLHRKLNGVSIPMGEMILTAARNFVKELKEVPMT
jgi:hypothetical protein